MRVFFIIMNCIGWVYTATCLIRVLQLPYRRFNRRACRFERYSSIEECPREYFCYTSGERCGCVGEIYPTDIPLEEQGNIETSDYFFILPEKDMVLRQVKIKRVVFSSIDDPKSKRTRYEVVKKYRKIDACLCIHDCWTDAIPLYKITWRDIYGKHLYSYGKSEDIEKNHCFISALLFVLGLNY